jgi:hypothetical protein
LTSKSRLTDKPTQFFDRDPYPKVETGTILAGQEHTIFYENGIEEVSEAKRIQVDAPPNTQITISRLEDNQEQTVETALTVADLPIVDGHPTLEFRQVERDVPLTIKKNQKINVTLQNPYGFTISYFVKIFKNALRFYTPPDEAEYASATR